MNFLVINSGSSSIKYQLRDMRTEDVLCSGLVERIGEASGGVLAHKIYPGTPNERKIRREEVFPDHATGMRRVAAMLIDADAGVIESICEIAAIGHRIVQGGDILTKACIVDESVKEDLRKVAPLAPLHNVGHLAGIEVCQEIFPHAPAVIVVDTEFHQTMPQEAYMYAVPYDWYVDLGVRRYGFHGTSHRYVSRKAAEFLNMPMEKCSLISCHLGNGSSLAAVRNGECIDTSMGLTPLAGVMMGTRCGDIDPAILPYVSNELGLSMQEIDSILNKESGLKAIFGSNDMRDLHAARAHFDPRAQLAFEMFTYRVKHYVGAYYAILPTINALVFTAGIGENDALTREAVCENLAHMGIILDKEKNAEHSDNTRDVSTPGSKVRILVIPTNEELEIAETTLHVLASSQEIFPGTC